MTWCPPQTPRDRCTQAVPREAGQRLRTGNTRLARSRGTRGRQAPRRVAPNRRAAAGDRRVPGGHRLLDGQRAVRRPEGQLVRQRLAARAELRAGVHVEQPHRLQQLAGARRPAPAAPAAAGTDVVHHQRHVDQRRREGGDRRRRASPGRRQRVEVQLHRAGAAGQLQRRDTPPGAARRRARRPRRRPRSSAQRPGCHGAYSAARTSTRSSGTPGGGQHVRAASTASAQPAGRPGAPPAGRLEVAGEHHGDVPRLRRHHRVGGGELLVGGAPVHAHRRRAAGADGAGGRPHRSRRGRGRGGPGRGCARRMPSSGPSSVVRSSGSSSDSGLASRTAGRRGSSAGRPSWSASSGDDERVREHLDVPPLGQRPGRRPGGAAAAGSDRRPGGAVGSTDGTRSYPSRRTTSSTRSAGSVRSGRQVGGVTLSTVPTPLATPTAPGSSASRSAPCATVQPTCSSRATTRAGG